MNADAELLPYLAVMSSIESLHRMTREERNLRGLVVENSDHLTSYNLYAEAYQSAGYVGEIYGMPRHLFESEAMEKWAEARGVLTKSIEDAALATACLFRGVGLELPSEMPLIGPKIERRFRELLAQWMPFDLALDEMLANGEEARVGRSSLCGPEGAVAGELRYFADRNGIPRASIEGTQLKLETLRKFAKAGEATVSYDAQKPAAPLVLTRTVEYFGFVLERQSETLKKFSPSIAGAARLALAEAVASGAAHHLAVQSNRAAIEEVRELHRRSNGQTPALDFAELSALYAAQLEAQNINSLLEFRNAKLEVRAEDYLSQSERERGWSLPGHVMIEDFKVPIQYEIGGERGIARLMLPEKLARTLDESELPPLDRPLAFLVSRGARGALRASTLEELQDALEGPWTPDEAPARKSRRIEARRAAKPRKGPVKRGGPPKRGGRR